jgi:hypothetical protein
MRNRSIFVCLFIVASSPACKRNEPDTPAAPAPRPMGRQSAPQRPSLGMMPMRPPLPKPEEVKGLLTEDKVTRFLTYQKEKLSLGSEAMGPGKTEKDGPDHNRLEKTKEDRYAKLAAAAKAALAKSGLTEDEMRKLTQVLSPYYATAYAMRSLPEKPDTANAEPPKPGSMEAAMLKGREMRKARLESARKELADRYGADVLELVQKHEPEFMEINKKMMGAAVGVMGGSR